MSSEDYEVFRVLKAERSKEGAKRRQSNEQVFLEAQQLAAQAGMSFAKHSDIHYSLTFHEYRLNIYPGNKRLYWDQNFKRPKFLKIKHDWNLLDVIKAAITINPIEFKLEPSHQDISVRAYQLWEAAGSPICDGKVFWEAAEKDLK